MYDPFEEIRKFEKEINRLFEKFFNYSKSEKFNDKNFRSIREPLSDLKETYDELIANIELPGVDKKDIQLLVTENKLEVRVEKKSELKIKKKGYLKEERSYKGFHKIIGLPCKVIPEQVESSYKDGILEVIMPKAEKKKLRKIEIK